MFIAVFITLIFCFLGTLGNNRGVTFKLYEALYPENPSNTLGFDYVNYDNDNIDIVKEKISFNNFYLSYAYISNGYIGTAIPNLGSGFSYDKIQTSSFYNLTNGWPLYNNRITSSIANGFFASKNFTIGYNHEQLRGKTPESYIPSIPTWHVLAIGYTKNDKYYATFSLLGKSFVGKIKNYTQTVSVTNGMVSTSYIWNDDFHLKYLIITHEVEKSLSVIKLEIKNVSDQMINFDIIDLLHTYYSYGIKTNDFGCDKNGIFVNFQPLDVENVYGSIYQKLISEFEINRKKHKFSALQKINATLNPGEETEVYKISSIVTSDLDPNYFTNSKIVENHAKELCSDKSPEELFKSNFESWNKKKISNRIVFENQKTLDILSKASLFQLASSFRSDSTNLTLAVGVSGQYSQSYAGLVFWDTDFWMFNAILPFFPEKAISIVGFRYYMLQRAKENTPSYYKGAVYPWTTGRYGDCTATGPCLDYEYFLNMIISMSAYNLYLAGAVSDNYLEHYLYPIVYNVALFFSDYVVFDEKLKKYMTYNLTGPDEFANNINNEAFTNAFISKTMQSIIDISKHLDKDVPESFYNILDNMYIPEYRTSDENLITLEFSDMQPLISVKQADVVMMTYPLSTNLISKKTQINNYFFYSKKQYDNGPAMTYPIYSIANAKLSLTGCSYQSNLYKLILPYVKHSVFPYFSELSNENYETNGNINAAFPFLTGSGGYIQLLIYGLLGLSFDYTIENKRISRFLTIDPISLSILGNSLELNDVSYLNNSLSFKFTDSDLILKNNGPKSDVYESEVKIRIGERNEKSGDYVLKDGDTLTIPLFKPEKTHPNSFSECELASFVSLNRGISGDVEYLINDGDPTTKWQMLNKTVTNKVIVDFYKTIKVNSIFLNWGDRPPKSIKIYNLSDRSKYDSISDVVHNINFESNVSYLLNEDGKDVQKQDDAFELVHSSDVTPLPFIYSEFDTFDFFLDLNNSNKTNVKFDNLETRFMLFEFYGVHDDNGDEGVKIYGINVE